ncbi:MAG: hypothetical protein EOP84_07685 [Verrucomicrobiaceae bacterium]|nr:MAG: hypothetical protein EOP84_07685 [Verrucomicrobiaceae bacterium]
MLVAFLAALTLGHSVDESRPVPKRVWKVTGLNMTLFPYGQEDWVMGADRNGGFRLDLKTGKQTFIDSRPDTRTAGRVPSTEALRVEWTTFEGAWVPARTSFRNSELRTVEIDGKGTRVLWDTAKRKLTLRKGDDSSTCTLYELRPGTNEVVASLRLPIENVSRLTGDPDSGIFAATYTSEGMSRYETRTQILLPGLRQAPKNPAFVYFLDERGLLGAFDINVPNVNSNAYASMGPLCLLDPGTGKMRWSNKQYNTGRWWGRYVLASTNDYGWAILDGATGKVLNANPAGIKGQLKEVNVYGDILMIRRDEPGLQSYYEGWTL